LLPEGGIFQIQRFIPLADGPRHFPHHAHAAAERRAKNRGNIRWIWVLRR
jgi:hypothetical protein